MIHHPQLGAVSYELTEVADDPQGQVADVIGLMRRYVLEDAGSPVLQVDLHQALTDFTSFTSSAAQRAQREEGGGRTGSGLSDPEKAAAIFWHVRSRVDFTRDEQTAAPLQTGTSIPIVEALIRPVDLAGMCNQGGCRRVGDCDDFSMYTAALLLTAGIPCAFVTVAADPREPGRMSHVYVAAYTGAGRIPLDTSHGDYPGWETQAVFSREEWPVAGLVQRAIPWVLAVGAAWWVGRKFGVWRAVWV